MARIYDDVTQLVGGTPLVKLNRLTEGLDATVAVKLEFYNPANSVKDRIGVAIVDAAEKSGALKPGGTIVEGTSGNTGIALAMVGAARGYKVILTMPETMSTERRVMLRAFGAEIVLTPGSEGMRGAVEKAQEIVANTENSIWAQQFANEANPEIQIVAVEPKDSPILNGGAPGPHKIQGLGANFIPELLDTNVYDEVLDATLEDSVAVARELGIKEAILGGISSGAIVWGALELAKRPENAGKLIVAVVCDFGERYISTVLYDDIR